MAPVNRARADAIVATLTAVGQSGDFSSGAEQVEAVAERLGVPVALVHLGVLRVSAGQIDQLTPFWPQREG